MLRLFAVGFPAALQFCSFEPASTLIPSSQFILYDDILYRQITLWDSPAPREARCQVQSLVIRRLADIQKNA